MRIDNHHHRRTFLHRESISAPKRIYRVRRGRSASFFLVQPSLGVSHGFCNTSPVHMINFAKVPSEYLLRFAHHPNSRPLPPTETSEGERRGLGFSEAAETKWRMNETSGESDAMATDVSLSRLRGNVNFRKSKFFIVNVDSNSSERERDPRPSIDGAFARAVSPSCSSMTSSKSSQPSTH